MYAYILLGHLLDNSGSIQVQSGTNKFRLLEWYRP